MNKDQGRHGARHPIRVVARRTGLKADLIRAWERRYDAISPERSAGRHRFYSDADIERLLLLRQATASGRTIGQVAHLADAALRALVDEDRQLDAAAPPPAASVATHDVPPSVVASQPAMATDDSVDLATYLDPTRRLDARALRHRLERSAVEMGYSRALSVVVVPLMVWLDRSEIEHRLRAMHGHLARFEIRAFVEDLIRRAPVDPRAPRLLVATPAGRSSEPGALLMAATAAFEGWDVTYLGSELPADEIVLAAHAMAAEAVAVQLTESTSPPSLGGDLTLLRRHLPELPILVGGRAAGYAEALRTSPELARTLSVHDLGELRTMLTQLRAQNARPSVVDASSGRPAPSPTISEGTSDGTPASRPLGHRALPLSREAFERFELDASLLTTHGQLHVGDLQSVRRLVHRLEQSPVLREHPERGPRAGRLHGFALLYEIAGEALRRYRTERNPGVWRR
ncbi:MAG: MerR family transcriptional regulator, partial [Acidobacteriota bacterium]